MVINEQKLPGAEISGNVDISCQYNPKIFQEKLKNLKINIIVWV